MLVGTWSLLVLGFSIYNIHYYAAIVSVEATDVMTAAEHPFLTMDVCVYQWINWQLELI